MTYKALDIANYIVNYCIDAHSPISNLKLQKIMYYIQAAFLVEYDDLAFSEDIIAWRYGPVIEEVYFKFKKHLDRPITQRITEKQDLSSFTISNGKIIIDTIDYDPSQLICNKDKNLINSVVNALKDRKPFQLVDSTHEELPWASTGLNRKIENDIIKRYFMKNKGRIYGKQWN